ncbi:MULTISPECIES: NAD(+) diphosphatase [Propionibacterium]|uniref:NAD(+) diphosphatase n=1 Tax=Propionibacterium freudenreichii subsp. freudenreichii TaxID=66712 RepID=A0A068VQV4_PROFF|nr:NAD(+) diphosphatase [Propionibacterium freudenreichii]MDN6797940.1 NAD(+) diphosphatase [Propionibacterium sp.]AJQ90904.1 NAD(+) diphosphatase [Propionibacterium freudenreichii subsp. freudenreichii]AWY95923.1 Hydrolase, NUDIX family [Propionibacterium freudenreichii]MCT2973552.1 NAD(+) diphosphatase [Propionibacterium freudenreichii]MCT2976343.1 NAD(+) diphosphatase [Propionibacterium freudenreichii]
MASNNERVGWSLSGWDDPALLDHASELRHDPENLVRLWKSAGSQLLLVDQQGRFDIDPFGRALIDADGAVPTESTIFVGLLDGTAWFARRVDAALSTTMRHAPLSAGQREIASAALASLNWYRRSRHCVVCGGPLVRTLGGFAAVCRDCDTETFPRTDPAIICAVLDPGDRIYLAHQNSWLDGRVSVLAGFIEAGESVEQAVAREIGEEADLRLTAMRYLGSQPWPLPRSLMLSFVARSTGGGQVDGEELAWGGWYSREQVVSGLHDQQLTLPPGASVGRRLVNSWLQGTLPSPEG